MRFWQRRVWRRLHRAGRCAYLHLDHATDYELIMRCIGSDYTSVMVDGSALPLDENIALTKSVVKVAKSAGIYTEKRNWEESSGSEWMMTRWMTVTRPPE